MPHLPEASELIDIVDRWPCMALNILVITGSDTGL